MDELREKAKRGLKCCIESIETLTCPDGCPYEDACWGEEDAALHLQPMRDALAVMEEQEAVTAEHMDTGRTHWYMCGNCHASIDPSDKYCRKCGRAVKWG